MSCVNLKSIIKHVHDSELEMHQDAEARLEELYEKDRRYLLEIFSSVDFCVDLLKEDGEYHIPRKDGEFIEWLIEEFSSPDMKKIRNGQYEEADIAYLYKVITGLLQILEDLDIEPIKIEAQKEIIMLKTNYPLIVRLWNIRGKFAQMWTNLMFYSYAPTFHMTMEQRTEYLDWMDDATEKLQHDMQNEFGRLWEETESTIKSNCIKLTKEDMELSERTKYIIEQLHNNSEYLELRQRLHELEEKKQPLVKYEKEKRKISKRIHEILNVVAKGYPLDVEKLSLLEKIMYAAEEGFVLTHKGGEEEWYLVPYDEYKPVGRRT